MLNCKMKIYERELTIWHVKSFQITYFHIKFFSYSTLVALKQLSWRISTYRHIEHIGSTSFEMICRYARYADMSICFDFHIDLHIEVDTSTLTPPNECIPPSHPRMTFRPAHPALVHMPSLSPPFSWGSRVMSEQVVCSANTNSLQAAYAGSRQLT